MVQAVITAGDAKLTCYVLTLCDVDYIALQEMYVGHLTRLRAHPTYKDALLCIAIENNLNMPEVQRMQNIIRQAIGSRNVHFVSSKAGVEGVHTGQAEKIDYAGTLQMIMTDGNLRVAADTHFVSLEPKGLVSTLYAQLGNFVRSEKTPKDCAFGTTKVAWTGKGNGQPDDMTIALQITLVWQQKMRTNVEFLQLCESAGLRP